jgi:hypothetical protein
MARRYIYSMALESQIGAEEPKPIFVTKSVFAESLGLDPRRLRKPADAFVMMGEKKLEVYRPLPAEVASEYRQLSQELFSE